MLQAVLRIANFGTAGPAKLIGGFGVDLSTSGPESSVLTHFACPRCKDQLEPAGERDWRCMNTACRYHTETFPTAGGAPALIDFEHSVVTRESVIDTGAAPPLERRPGFISRIMRPLAPKPKATMDSTQNFLAAVKALTPTPRILVIGGGRIGYGAEALYEDPDVELVSTDIYPTALTQALADAHALPCKDGHFDGIWIQAVLEHVLEPTKVVDEIHRALKPDGVVYAETPFMSQVHEGAYDFTRFSKSGHRWLFRHFETIEDGVTAGAGTTLLWSIGYFAAALFRSYKLKKLSAVPFFWLPYLDNIMSQKHSEDGANAVYFLGRRADRSITPAEAISAYTGAQ